MAKVKSKAGKAALGVLDQKGLGERENLYLPPGGFGTGPDSKTKSADPNYGDKVTAMAVSIFLDGQIEPAVCYRPTPETGPVLFAGHTRAAAVELIRQGFTADNPRTGDKTTFHNPDAVLWAVVLPGVTTEEEAFVLSAVENFTRNDLNPIQEGIVHAKLRAAPFEWTDTRIANTFGYNNTNRVSRIKAVMDGLDDKYLLLVERGELALQPAVELLQVPADERDGLLAKAKGEKDDGSVTYDGSVIRAYLQSKAEVKGEETQPKGGEGKGEETPKTPGKSVTEKAAPKKNAAALLGMTQGYVANGEEEGKDVTLLLNAFNMWFANEHGERALLNAIKRFRGDKK